MQDGGPLHLALGVPDYLSAEQAGDGDIAVLCPLTVGGSFEAKTRALAGRLAATVAKLGEVEKSSAGKRKADLRDFRQKVFFDWSF